MRKLVVQLRALSVFMKEEIKQILARKLIRRGTIKLLMRNLIDNEKLTEEIQNYYLDQLGALDEEIGILEKALNKLK